MPNMSFVFFWNCQMVVIFHLTNPKAKEEISDFYENQDSKEKKKNNERMKSKIR